MPAAAERIWLPGRGAFDIQVLRVDKAVQEYDENLRFGRNEDNGQWCVFRIVRGDAPLPILGFRDVPHPDDALRRLYQSDALRRGEEILDQMNRENEKTQAALEAPQEEAIQVALEEAAGQTEHLMRTLGRTRYVKSYRPRTNRMGGWS